MQATQDKPKRVKRQSVHSAPIRNRLFVESLLEGDNQTDAVYKAGYKPKDRKNASQLGYELLKKPEVLALLVDNEREAEEVIVNILGDSTEMARDRLAAAKLLLAYTRGNPVSRNENVNVSVSLEDILMSHSKPS